MSDLSYCPICLGEVDWNGCTLVIGSTGGSEIVDPRSKKKVTVGDYERARAEGDTFLTRAVLADDPYVRCPAGDRLPLFVTQTELVTIAVIGHTAASKSTFIAAMAQALRTESSGIGGLLLLSVSGGGRLDIEKRIETVFTDRKALPATETDVEQPIFFKVRNQGTMHDFCLMFRDISGDDLGVLSKAQRVGHLAAADGLIYVVDSTRIRGVGERMSGDFVYEPTGNVLGNFLTVVSTVSLSDVIPGTQQAIPSSIPIAVAFSKADEIESFATFRVRDHLRNSEFHADEWVLNWDAVRCETLDAMGFAIEYGERASLVERVTSSFWSFSFHFVSATGVGTTVDSDGVTRYSRTPVPLAVTKPLLTLLARLGHVVDEQCSCADFLPFYPLGVDQ